MNKQVYVQDQLNLLDRSEAMQFCIRTESLNTKWVNLDLDSAAVLIEFLRDFVNNQLAKGNGGAK